MRFSLPFLIASGLCLLSLSAAAQPFKHKYYDPSVNVNDLILEADQWYLENGTGPGKGWKTYQRWRTEFERRFYPTGDRSNFDPQISAKEMARFKQNAGAKVAGLDGHWTFRGPGAATNILPPSWAAGLGRVETAWAGYVTADTVYLGSRSGGFWKTTDGGANWHATTQDLAAVGVVDIEVHPDRPQEVWIVTRHAAGYSYGLLKSTDFGETWNTTSLSYGPQQAYLQEMIMASADTFFVSGNGGIQRSTDAGATWASCYSGNMVTIHRHPTNSQILYAFDSNSMSQLRRTTNGGQSWTNHTVTGNTGYPFLASSAASPNNVYVGSGSGIFKSTDTGLSWTNISIDPTNSGVMTLGVSATQPDEIYAGSLNQYKSTDGGNNWFVFADWINYFGNNYLHADMRFFRAWGDRILIGTDGFLGLSTNNGLNWSIINQGTGLKEFYRIGCSAMNAENVVGGSQDNGSSAMLDGTWYEWIGADGMQAHFDYNNPDIWFGTIQNGNLQRTNQGGQNAQDVSPSANGTWITPSVIDPSNENTLFIAYDSIFKSNDNGDTWRVAAGFTSGNFDEIAISPSDSNYLYVSRAGVIRRSSDNGQTWTFVNAGLPNQFINRIAVHPNDPLKVAVAFSGFNANNKVFYSTNAGQTWTNLTGNLPNLPADALAWTEGPPARMILGMDVGVYYADEGTSAWTLHADSLPAVVINDLEVLEGAGLIRVGTWGRGVWEAPLPGRLGTPQIVRVIAEPASFNLRPKPADTVRIKAVIRNGGGIASATLRWGTSPSSQPNALPMQSILPDTFTAQIPPHPAGTRIYYRITGTAPNGDSARTERLMYRVKAAIPCNAAGSPGTSFDFIDTVKVAALNNASGQDYYGDFRNLYTTVYRDSSYQIMSSLNYSFALDSMFTWVDWNHDGDFQTGEQVVMTSLNADHNSYGNFTVPHILNIPDTIVMRVRCIYANNPTADPCNNYFGEVEDYSLVITDTLLVGTSDPLVGGIRIAPNPAGQEVRILRLGELTGEMQVRILDLRGTEVLAPRSTFDRQLSLDIQALVQGVYVVEAVLEDGIYRYRLHVAR